jgi:VIT1/CCC1 family predicted Fe2+/Mn2+ transporter
MKFSCPLIQSNEGTADRIIRVIIGSVALLAGFFWLTGTWQTIVYVVGAAGLATGIVGFCGLYKLLGISTCPIKK